MQLPARLELIKIGALKEHEEVELGDLQRLIEVIQSRGALTRPIAADSDTLVVLDGVHRLNALKRLQCRLAPAYLIDYQSDKIIVLSRNNSLQVSKEEVINAALTGRRFPPKTTNHVIRMVDGSLRHISWIEREVIFPLTTLRNERIGQTNDVPYDSIKVCEYCGKEFDSKDMDGHLFAEHGVPI